MSLQESILGTSQLDKAEQDALIICLFTSELGEMLRSSHMQVKNVSCWIEGDEQVRNIELKTRKNLVL